MKYKDTEHPILFEMNLCQEPFLLMESGEKTIELRLLDEKRRNVEVGDTIRFTMVGHYERHLEAKVIALHKFPTFADLFATELFSRCGFEKRTPVQAVECMRKYYSEEQEKKYGVVGIEIEVMTGDKGE